MINDRLVDECYALVRSCEADGLLPDLKPRRGRQGMHPRTVLVLLLLCAWTRGTTLLSVAWELGEFQLHPPSRRLLDLREEAAQSPRAEHASSRRFYRGFARLVKHFDPVAQNENFTGYSRRERPARDVGDKWLEHCEKSSHARALTAALELLCSGLVLAPVTRELGRHGSLGAWSGDVGVDATAVPVYSKQARPNHRTASVEYLAGLYKSGSGDDDWEFGYSLTLAVTAAEAGGRDAGLQVCIGSTLHRPARDIGASALRGLNYAHSKGVPVGQLAADRAYTNCKPADFQDPVRRLGYELVLDYRRDQLGLQGETGGALWIDGNLYCCGIPQPLIDASSTLARTDSTSEQRARGMVEARQNYLLQLKQSADANGAVRMSCPATGKFPKVSCPRRTPASIERDVVDFGKANSAKLLPIVDVPELPVDDLPAVCKQGSITVHADSNAKLRQSGQWKSETWRRQYAHIRNLNEGGNSLIEQALSVRVSDPSLRLAKGFVAQSLLVAVQICAHNLAELQRFKRENHPDAYTREFDQTPDASEQDVADPDVADIADSDPD